MHPSIEDSLSQILRLDQGPGRGSVVAFVGGGGKTSAMFALARELVAHRVIATTTTRMRDPRFERGRTVDRVIVDPIFARPIGGAAPESPAPRRGAGPLVLASGLEAATETEVQKLVGVHPSRPQSLREGADFVLVEADGSRGLSIKAPSDWEPVVPDGVDLVVGVIGLDCLRLILGPESAHRPETLGALVGCEAGEPIRPAHLLRLARAPEGLFKAAPRRARRAIILNKADCVSPRTARELVDALAGEGADADVVVACSLRDGTGRVEIAAYRQGS